MIPALASLLILATAAAAWFARGEREALRQRDAARDAWRAVQGAQERGEQKASEVRAEAAELARDDHLAELLDEKLPPP